MEKERFDAMLAKVAAMYQTTPEHIIESMAQALEEDAADLIPHTGVSLTLEELVEYLAETLEHPYLP